MKVTTFVILGVLAAACGSRGDRRLAVSGQDGAASARPMTCRHDDAPCEGACNAYGYCEHDRGWGSEIRVPARRYVVAYRGRMGNITDDAIYSFPSAFWIDKREASNAVVRRCVECKLDLPDDNLPAQLTRDQAIAFCAAAGKRLATNPEWEAAARGPTPCTDPATLRGGDEHCNTRGFPWVVKASDDQYEQFVATICDHVLMADCGAPTGPRPVEDRPKGASTLGVQEMIGNVSEWIIDIEPGDDRGMVKGGDWTTPGDEGNYSYLSIGARAREKFDARFGVRCVRGPVMDVKPRLKASAFGPAQQGW